MDGNWHKKRFQFLMVRLKVVMENEVKKINIKFQFLMVRLKVKLSKDKDTLIIIFQFLMVRLKES